MNRIRVPPLDEKLAEFLGIHFGDGSLYIGKRQTYRYALSLNLKKDYEYSLWVYDLFGELFDIALTFQDFPKKTLRMMRCCSKKLMIFLHTEYGVPIGKKTFLKIPFCILNSNALSKCFIRGFFDTDGCVFIRNTAGYEYPVIKLTTNVYHLAMQLCMKLSELGFRARIQKKDNHTSMRYDVVLNGWEQLELWKNLIGTRNKRNILAKGLDGI